jgi:hypothetical protein
MKRICTTSILIAIVAMTSYAQSSLIPIVELKNSGLMGGVQNGRWVAPTTFRAKMKEETEFVLVGWNGVEEGGVSLAKKLPQEDVCEDFTRMQFELEQDHGVGIGSSAKWNPMPRPLKKIDLNNPTYKAAVKAFLKTKGVANTIVQIKEAFRVDLEGDGVEEVVLSATYYKNGLTSGASVGDYSFVMVRKAVGKVVTNHLLEGDFIRKKIDFGAPTENHISAIADLNGDGKMEIVLYGFYYEGDFSGAWEMKNGRPVKIKEFEIGCGV